MISRERYNYFFAAVADKGLPGNPDVTEVEKASSGTRREWRNGNCFMRIYNKMKKKMKRGTGGERLVNEHYQEQGPD